MKTIKSLALIVIILLSTNIFSQIKPHPGKKFNESLFTAIFYTQFDLFLFNSFSIGLVADYIYLPKEIPGIPELEISSRKLGNFSFGALIGLHF